jgi:hypothetical protein
MKKMPQPYEDVDIPYENIVIPMNFVTKNRYAARIERAKGHIEKVVNIDDVD